jgi:ABC-type branched-subunit amino acid transport system substrate-binding protein
MESVVRLPSRPSALLLAAAVSLVAAGCGGSGGSGSPAGGATVTVVVSAPVSTSPWLAGFERTGAQLAASQINSAHSLKLDGKPYRVDVKVLDNAGSPQQAAANARQAVSLHAAVLITDGVGAAVVAGITAPAHLPTFVVFEGGTGIVDAERRPTMFRLAPANKYMTMRLADYLAGHPPKVGIVADDTSYGQDGLTSLTSAFQRDQIAVAAQAVVPSGTSDVATQVLAQRRAGVTELVVWASAPVVAATVQAARSAGWQVPIWAGPSGEDPLVRQRLADHPGWLNGFGFVSFRITAEVGAAPFASYRKAYVQEFGEQKVGVKQDGKDVVQPPDWSMFSYDVVNLVAAALAKSGAVGKPLLDTLAGNVVITGANGDERGYSATTREGVSPDDIYFAQFHGFTFAPVTDDLLSQNLPTVPQTS